MNTLGLSSLSSWADSNGDDGGDERVVLLEIDLDLLMVLAEDDNESNERDADMTEDADCRRFSGGFNISLTAIRSSSDDVVGWSTFSRSSDSCDERIWKSS